MKTDKTLLQKCAKGLIDLALDSTGHTLVYEELTRREPKTEKIEFRSFCEEYVPAKLALGCLFWTGCCENHGFQEKALRNLYFQEVMSLFESPKALGNAKRFSECLYASNASKEDPPVLAILVCLFHKLGLEAMTGREDDQTVSSGFQFMAEVSEALKTVFEDQFDEFIYANNDFEAE